MPSDILAKLFGSASRLKIIRLFLLNPAEIFPLKAICRRAKITKEAGRKEIALLSGINFIIPKTDFIEMKMKKGRIKKQKIRGWKINDGFVMLSALKNFILNTAPFSKKELVKKLQKNGHIKLIILSGIFNEGGSNRADIFIVGDSIRKNSLERTIRDIEAEIGKELAYAVFSTQEFSYRLGMYDKFIRDILDYPHEKILNKLDI